jgi:hypothetical protein
MRPKSDLREAAAILTSAISGHARVQGHASKPGEATVLDVISAAGKKARLRLIPWGEVHAQGRSEVGVWVLGRGDRYVRDQLRAKDQNFVDLSGAIRVHLPWLLIDRTDLTPARKRAKSQETRNPFSDRGSLVTRTLLEYGTERSWTLRELAEEAEVSLGLGSYVVAELVRRNLVTAHAVGRARRIQLNSSAAIIEHWSREYDWQRNRAAAFHAPVGSPKRFLNRLPELLGERLWALTLQAGASLAAPHASWDLIHVYVKPESGEDPSSIGEAAGWSPAPDGKVVLMTPFYRTSVWRGARKLRGLPVVSTLQLILDLWHYPIRGREQAEHLIARVLPREQHHG